MSHSQKKLRENKQLSASLIVKREANENSFDALSTFAVNKLM